MKTFHIIFGIAMVITFLLTGQYMDRYLNHLVGTPDFERMLYRSRHIYILLSGLLHVGIGAYFTYRIGRVRITLQLLGSLLIAIASVLFVVAFIYEPPSVSFYTPYSRRAIYLTLTGTLLHLISCIGSHRGKEPGPPDN
jgi:hypothetical protein